MIAHAIAIALLLLLALFAGRELARLVKRRRRRAMILKALCQTRP